MKVLLSIHHSLDAGAGAPAVALGVAAGLRSIGHEVDVLSFDSVPRLPGARARELLYPELAALRLRARAGAYDVIDASTGDAWVWAALGRPGSRDALLVTRSHGLEHAYRAARDAQPGARGLGERLYHDRFRLWEVTRSLRAADLSLFGNAADRAYAVARLGVAADRAHVVPNGVDDALLGLPAPQRRQGTLRAAVVGSWDPRKGSHLVAEAVDRCPSVEFTFLGAGPGAPVPARAKAVARFDRADLPALLANQDVLILASYAEGFSLALLEGMACGLAPVATSVGAAPNLLADGTGLLIEPGGADGLVTALQRLDGDRDLLASMRQRAWAKAQEHTWEAAARRTEELYRQAMATGRHA